MGSPVYLADRIAVGVEMNQRLGRDTRQTLSCNKSDEFALPVGDSDPSQKPAPYRLPDMFSDVQTTEGQFDLFPALQGLRHQVKESSYQAARLDTRELLLARQF
jgi:hypothetical protein